MEIEKELEERDLIVSSTNNKGIIEYVNSTFSRISEYTKDELYGSPHNIIRHPDMPKAMFKYIWNNLLNKKPVVAYVKNYVKGNEKYYWVKAVMYPRVVNNEIKTITSYRTKVNQFEINQIKEVYKILSDYEKSHDVEASLKYFMDYLKNKNLTYDRMIGRLNDNQQILSTALLQLDVSKFRTDHLIFRSRIESLVEKGYKNIEVCDTNCCEFGKKLALLESENFSKDNQFIEIKRLHENIHKELQLFVEVSESKKTEHMNRVHNDIKVLFKLMKELKNNHNSDI
jgi:PAS domain S-box-containing protein